MLDNLAVNVSELTKFRVTTKLGRLPSNVWDKIFSYLPLSDQASMSMSCAYLYTKLAKEKGVLARLERPSNYKEKMKFLFRIPKLFPEMALCKGCVRYHDTWVFLPGEWQSSIDGYHEDDPGILTMENEDVTLTWGELHNLGRVHRHAGSYSPKPANPVDGWQVSTHFKLDVASDHWTVRFEYKRDLLTSLLQVQKPDRIPQPYFCQHHVNYSGEIDVEMRYQLKKHTRPWEDEDPERKLFYTGKVRRCAYCPTEVNLEIGQIGAAPGFTRAKTQALRRAKYEIVISRMVDLGTLYTPCCCEWQALTKPIKGDMLETIPFHLGNRKGIFERYYGPLYAYKARERPFDDGLMLNHCEMLMKGIVPGEEGQLQDVDKLLLPDNSRPLSTIS